MPEFHRSVSRMSKERVPHPLSSLTEEEICLVANACRTHAGERGFHNLKFYTISLVEPSRDALAKFEKEKVLPQRVGKGIFCINHDGKPVEITAEIRGNKAKVLSWKQVKGALMPLVPEDFRYKGDFVRADPEVQRLCAQYNLDMSEVEVGIWPVFPASAEEAKEEVTLERQVVQAFLYWCPEENSNIYAYPLPWVPLLDCQTNKVIKIMHNHDANSLPEQCTEAADYASDLFSGDYRTDIKPLDIVQPEGPSYVVEGDVLMWQKWSMRVRFDAREGMILHDVCFNHGGSQRPILHRASMPEMSVPYAETQAPFHRRQAFDAGDCGFGFCANSLVLGCDCVGAITYMDGVVNDAEGNSVLKEKVICIHEEDAGMLWKHTEMRTMSCETRRARKLVLSTIATLGNYEYSFNWYFFQDASIHFEVKLTGILSTNLASPADGKDPLYGVLVLPRVVAGHHQHMFCARLDFAVDNPVSGEGLVVSEVDCVLEPPERNIHGGAFRAVKTELTKELQARRVNDPLQGRTWHVSNPKHLHPITGKPVSYKLIPANTQPLLARPGSSIARAGFATHSLWVTQANEHQLWPGGDYPLQNLDPGGLYKWVEADRKITNPVVWHVFGTTHVPRPEDFPIMPVDTIGFQLRPCGFFASNPTLDVPPHINRMSKLHSCCPAPPMDYTAALSPLSSRLTGDVISSSLGNLDVTARQRSNRRFTTRETRTPGARLSNDGHGLHSQWSDAAAIYGSSVAASPLGTVPSSARGSLGGMDSRQHSVHSASGGPSRQGSDVPTIHLPHSNGNTPRTAHAEAPAPQSNGNTVHGDAHRMPTLSEDKEEDWKPELQGL